MPKCPECGTNIDHLIWYEKVWQKARFDGKDYQGWDIVSVLEGYYACPECGADLFSDEEEARKFLEGGEK